MSLEDSNPAEYQANEFIKLINEGDPTKFRQYIETTFSVSLLDKFTVEDHIGFVSGLYDMSRGLTIQETQVISANEVKLLLKNHLTEGWFSLEIDVDSEEENRINRVDLLPAKLPESVIKQLNSDDILRELEAFMQKLVDADVFSGAVLLANKGKPVFQAAYGMANKDFDVPNTINTKFNLGSMNKMFTGIAIAQLVERGKLSFEDSLSKFLPSFPNPTSADKIKIKHLLTHTAGLGYYFSEKFWNSSRSLYRTIDDMMKLVEDEELLFEEPGTEWQYSNTGMLVLGKVIECVTGQSYYQYIQENIYEPADMQNTGCFELDKVHKNLAVGYSKLFTDEGAEFQNNLFQHVIRGASHGGGFSTVNDLLKFDLALRANKLLKAENVNLVLSAKPELKSPNYGYGFGVTHSSESNTEVVVAGHGGGFHGVSANLDMFLGTPWTAVVLSNYSMGMQPVAAKMYELLVSAGEVKVAI